MDMKKILISITILCLALMMQAQSNPVDDLFSKYSEKEGFTVVTISGKMFSMFANKESESNAEGNVMSKLKSIRILSVEDSLLNSSINFYSELSKKLDFSAFEELMVVKEGSDITKFLIKQKGDVISELVVITGGPGGNSLISIQGNLDLKSLSNISKEIGIQDLESLDKIDKK
jgi:glutathione peroxidase-family protein